MLRESVGERQDEGMMSTSAFFLLLVSSLIHHVQYVQYFSCPDVAITYC